MVTSDPVRDRMVVLTRSMSAAVSLISWAMEGAAWLSKGTMTAKAALQMEGRARIETVWLGGKYTKCHTRAAVPCCKGAVNRLRREPMLTTREMRGAAAAGLAQGQRIAVLVPCYNEEVAIAQVVAEFRAVLPEAIVYVYDNNSTDRTVEV